MEGNNLSTLLSETQKRAGGNEIAEILETYEEEEA
jgi:hypothetical protein